MTVHLISVGVSLLDAMANPRTTLASSDPELRRSILLHKPHRLFELHGADDSETASRWLAGAVAAEKDPGRRPDAATALTTMVHQTHPDRWPSRLSAELSTFAKMPHSVMPLDRDDVAVLICSDTAAGLAGGLWNGVALAGGDLGRLSYLPNPGALPETARGRVMITRILGLDAGTEAGFQQAMKGLGVLARNLLRDCGIGDSEPFECYLSGGFKAAIPYLIGIAEAIRSLEGGREVRAWVMHDTTDKPISLPLRRIAPEVVRQELVGWSADDSRPHKPDSVFLEGYAYDRDGTSWRLTPFGAGLRALFGIAPTGLLQ